MPLSIPGCQQATCLFTGINVAEKRYLFLHSLIDLYIVDFAFLYSWGFFSLGKVTIYQFYLIL